MSGENTVVNVQITLQDAAAAVPDFGTPLVVADTGGAWVGMKTFSADADGLLALIAAGVNAKSWAYLKLASFASAIPTVRSVKIWSRAVKNVQTIDITPTTLTQGYVHRLTLNGVEKIYTNGASETVNTICDALEPLFEAADATITATPDNVSATKLTLTTSGYRTSLASPSRSLTIKDTSADAGIAAELNGALAEDDQFFAVFIDANCKAEIVAADSWCASNKRPFFAHAIDSEILTNASTDVAATLKLAASSSTLLFHDYDTLNQGYCSAVASWLTYHPGTANMHMWSLVAKGFPRLMTPSELAYAKDKRVAVITNMFKTKCVVNGRSGSGRPISSQFALLYLGGVLQSDVGTLVLAQPQIPFTSGGISQIQSVMAGRLKLEADYGMISDNWKVVPKKIADVTAAEKATGDLNTMKFNAVLIVGVDTITINGTMTI